MIPTGTFDAPQKSSVLPWVITASAVALAVGVTTTVFVMQGRQSSQTELMTRMMLEMQQQAVVTRSATPELLAVPAAPAAAPVVAPAAAPATSIPSATAALSVAPQPAAASAPAATQEEKVAEAIAAANANKVRMLTEGIVAGLYDVTSENAGDGARLALNSRNAPTAVESLESLLTEAVASGEIELPSSVSNSNGSIDSQTMLFDLVQRSLENGTDAEIAAAAELRRRAFEASTAKIEMIGGQRYYTVEGGDSLAYIALQFYGSTNEFSRIYQANRDIISAPDKIQIGQRLLIPSV